MSLANVTKNGDDGFGVPARRLSDMPVQEIVIWTPSSLVREFARVLAAWTLAPFLIRRVRTDDGR